jgi:hypothetical protein
MEENGLAAAYAAEQGMRPMTPPVGRGPGKQAPQVSVNEIVALLKQGITPEELAQNGVPVELIEKALMMVQQEAQAAQGQVPAEQGLAGMYASQGAV